MDLRVSVIAALGSEGPKALWFLTRSTGAVALVLLSAVLVLGVLGPMRVSSPRWPRFALSALHRDLSLLAIVFVAIHVSSTVLDGFAPIGWIAAILPFASPYRTVWLGLGAVAFDLLLALVLTSVIRARLGHRRWRAIHWLAYASWPVAAFHAVGTGSDAAQPWMLGLMAACACSILVAVLLRLQRTDPDADLRPWLGLLLAVPLALIVFVVVGPLAPEWARRAGTPAEQLDATAASERPATARLAGNARSTPVAGGALIDLLMRVTGGAWSGDLLRIRIAGRPEHGRAVRLIGSQVDLLPSRGALLLTGVLTSLRGARLNGHRDELMGTPRMKAELVSSTGDRFDLAAKLHVDRLTGGVTGTLSAVSRIP